MKIKTILAAFVLILPLLSVSAVARSFETWICLKNTTPERKLIQVTDIDNNDWDGVGRPDRNFHNVSIEPGQTKCEREEINIYGKRMFTFLIYGRRYLRAARIKWVEIRQTSNGGSTILKKGWIVENLVLPLSANLNILLGDPNDKYNKDIDGQFGYVCNAGDNCSEFTIEDVQ